MKSPASDSKVVPEQLQKASERHHFNQLVITLVEARDYVHERLRKKGEADTCDRPYAVYRQWIERHCRDPYFVSIGFTSLIPSLSKKNYYSAYMFGMFLKPFTDAAHKRNPLNLDIRPWQIFRRYPFTQSIINVDLIRFSRLMGRDGPRYASLASLPDASVSSFEVVVYLLYMGQILFSNRPDICIPKTNVRNARGARGARKNNFPSFRINSRLINRFATAVTSIIRAWDNVVQLCNFQSIEALTAPYVNFDSSNYLYSPLQTSEGFASVSQSNSLLNNPCPTKSPTKESFFYSSSLLDSVADQKLRILTGHFLSDLTDYLLDDDLFAARSLDTGPISVFLHSSSHFCALAKRFDKIAHLISEIQTMITEGRLSKAFGFTGGSNNDISREHEPAQLPGDDYSVGTQPLKRQRISKSFTPRTFEIPGAPSAENAGELRPGPVNHGVPEMQNVHTPKSIEQPEKSGLSNPSPTSPTRTSCDKLPAKIEVARRAHGKESNKRSSGKGESISGSSIISGSESLFLGGEGCRKKSLARHRRDLGSNGIVADEIENRRTEVADNHLDKGSKNLNGASCDYRGVPRQPTATNDNSHKQCLSLEVSARIRQTLSQTETKIEVEELQEQALEMDERGTQTCNGLFVIDATTCASKLKELPGKNIDRANHNLHRKRKPLPRHVIIKKKPTSGSCQNDDMIHSGSRTEAHHSQEEHMRKCGAEGSERLLLADDDDLGNLHRRKETKVCSFGDSDPLRNTVLREKNIPLDSQKCEPEDTVEIVVNEDNSGALKEESRFVSYSQKQNGIQPNLSNRTMTQRARERNLASRKLEILVGLPTTMPLISSPPVCILNGLGALWGKSSEMRYQSLWPTQMWPRWLVKNIDKADEDLMRVIELSHRNVYMDTSKIERKRLGLFALQDFEEDDVICEYFGTLVYECLEKCDDDNSTTVVLRTGDHEKNFHIDEERFRQQGVVLPHLHGNWKVKEGAIVKRVYVVPAKASAATMMVNTIISGDESEEQILVKERGTNATLTWKRGANGIEKKAHMCETSAICVTAIRHIRADEEICAAFETGHESTVKLSFAPISHR